MIACRARFQTGEISKENYLEKMYEFHSYLFEYTKFIKSTDIWNIEIQEEGLIFTLRNFNIKLLCTKLDKRVTPIEILNFSSYEKKEAEIFFSLLAPNMVFFDIGAHVGFYSIQAAKREETIKIYAFEPIPQTFDMLKKNILLNNVDNIHPYNVGFLDVNEDVDFYFNPIMSGNASARNLSGINSKKITSKVVSLDNFLLENEISSIDIIKCDIEGGELLVFRGGLDSLKKNLPIIFTEMLRKWSEKFNYHPNEIIQLLAGLGYRCFTASGEKLIEFFIMNKESLETNFFFLHNEKHSEQIKSLVY
jgi:FkbM family methyltransferase